MKKTSMKSPKNKFRASITYSRPLNGIGSTSSLTANGIEELKSLADFYINQAQRSNAKCTVVVSENLSVYPNFDWQEIERYKA